MIALATAEKSIWKDHVHEVPRIPIGLDIHPDALVRVEGAGIRKNSARQLRLVVAASVFG
jgi:hypothetical protein